MFTFLGMFMPSDRNPRRRWQGRLQSFLGEAQQSQRECQALISNTIKLQHASDRAIRDARTELSASTHTLNQSQANRLNAIASDLDAACASVHHLQNSLYASLSAIDRLQQKLEESRVLLEGVTGED